MNIHNVDSRNGMWACSFAQDTRVFRKQMSVQFSQVPFRSVVTLKEVESDNLIAEPQNLLLFSTKTNVSERLLVEILNAIAMSRYSVLFAMKYAPRC